ncbi:GNAT family N-acetyltransferase [Butyricimonas paravirosa]
MEIRSRQENFRLREWKLSDIVSLAKYINNVKIWNNVRDGLPLPYTMLDADKYIRMVQAQSYVQNFAIEVEGEAVGGVGIVPSTDVERLSAEVGYWLGEDYWGRGIMSEAVALLVDYVFQETEIIRLFASVYEYNPASMKVLEKVGFTRQAILRDAAIKNGRVIDMYYYDLVKREI